MTLANETSRSDHVGDNSTTDWAYEFRIDAESEIKILLDGVEQSSGFTLTNIGN